MQLQSNEEGMGVSSSTRNGTDVFRSTKTYNSSFSLMASNCPERRHLTAKSRSKFVQETMIKESNDDSESRHNRMPAEQPEMKMGRIKCQLRDPTASKDLTYYS